MEASIEEALLAADLYNQTNRKRRLEGFLVHMHIAWLYLLQAEWQKEKKGYHFLNSNGRYVYVDGERKTWELQRFVNERWSDSSPVKANLDLTISLRNKIEHRFDEEITLATIGHAQALMLNFEDELTNYFGDGYSLANQLRFPVFIGTITTLGKTKIEELKGKLPSNIRDLIKNFENNLDTTIRNDQRYEFRVSLIPNVGKKSDADLALKFIREEDLSDEEKKMMASLSSPVLVREKIRPVSSEDKYRPSEVAELVQNQIPFKFRVDHVVRAWKKLKCRPSPNAPHPEKTDRKYCVYDRAHKDYLYTKAFIKKLVNETKTAPKFLAFIGTEPVKKKASK